MVRRLFVILALLVFVSMLILTSGIAYAQTIVDSDIDAVTGHEEVWQIKSFYANGRHWIFFQDEGDNNLYFRTSTDRGDTWSARTKLRDDVGQGQYFSMWWDGTYGYYVVCDFDADLQFRRFTPNPDGTIDFSAAETEIHDFPGAHTPYVSVDSNGYPWVASQGDVWKGNTTDGTWVTEEWWEDESCSQSAAILPLTSGRMVLIQSACPDPTHELRAKRWTGAAWGSNALTLSEVNTTYAWSAVAQDDDVHLVFSKKTTKDIIYTKWSYSSNTWSGETTLHAGATTYSFPEIQRNIDNNDLFVYHSNHPTANHVYYHQYVNSETTWYVDYDWINDVDGITDPNYLNADYTCTASSVGLYYVYDTPGIKYKRLDLPTEVETLEASAVTEDAATIRGDILSLGSGTPVWRGFFWGTDPTLTTYEIIGEAGEFGVGTYSQILTDLESDTIYYYKAYITDEYANDFEGEIVSFMTLQPNYESEQEQQTGNNTMIPEVPDEPGGWIRPPKDWGEIGIGDATIPLTFFVFLCLVALIVPTGLLLTKYTKSLGILFMVLGFILGFFCFWPMGGYLDWWVMFPYFLVGIALIMKEQQWGWS